MVLYFSATGNTEHIAKMIAEDLGDECLNLLERIKKKDYSVIRSDKPFVICTPIYVCEMPLFITDFLLRLKLRGNRKMYYVVTCGGYAGCAKGQAKRISLRKKGEFMGLADLWMASNYIVSKRYGVKTNEENLPHIREAIGRVPEICADIKAGRKLTSRHVFLFEKIIIPPVSRLWSRVMQKTEPFYTTSDCIGCGKCVKLCPLNRIHMENGRPVWEGMCAHCMGCISNCPTMAIEYGDRTKGVPRYSLKKTLSSKSISE